MINARIRSVRILLSCTLASLPLTNASAQRYILDDGKTGVYYSQDPLDVTHSGAMQAFTVPGGGSDVIENVSVVTTPFWYFDWSQPASVIGSTITIAIWDDPNGDKNPSDAVYLGSYDGHTIQNEATGQFQTYAFPTPIPVSGTFFVGVSLESLPPWSAVACIDQSQGYRYDSWYFNSTTGSIDLVNLQQNTGPPANDHLVGRFLIRANDGDYGDAIGTDSCLAAPSSTGQRALLAASGNTDAASGDYRVHLTATYLPPDRAGFFLASQTQVPWFNPLNSMGRLCLGGTILRIGPSLSVSAHRTLSWDVDLGNVDSYGAPVPSIDVVAAGQTWTFQGWYRDLDPGPTSNLTEAVSVTFQ